MSDRLNVVLSVDALSPAMAGIGRYAWELARGLPLHPQVHRLRCYRAGRWVPDPQRLLQASLAADLPEHRRLRWRWPRAWQQAYWRQQLRQAIFHAPNYFLPPAAEGGVATVHDLSVLKYPETHPVERVRQFELHFHDSLSRAAHLITDSQTVRQELITLLGVAADRVTAVPLGVGAEYRPHVSGAEPVSLQAMGLSRGGYTLCVATVEPRKRIDALLQAYRALPPGLRSRHPLVLAGSPGWRCEGLLDAIAHAQSQGWLRYLHFVPESQLPALYAGAALFAYFSVDEGFGLPVVEAMASGVPVVVADGECLREVTQGAALMTDPLDSEAAAQALARGLQDLQWRRQAIAAGLRVAAGYSWSACIERTVQAYRRAAQAH